MLTFTIERSTRSVHETPGPSLQGLGYARPNGWKGPEHGSCAAGTLPLGTRWASRSDDHDNNDDKLAWYFTDLGYCNMILAIPQFFFSQIVEILLARFNFSFRSSPTIMPLIILQILFCYYPIHSIRTITTLLTPSSLKTSYIYTHIPSRCVQSLTQYA